MAGTSNGKVKAKWTDSHHKVFVHLCLEQTLDGNRPKTCLNKVGWKTVLEEFYKRTGVKYDKKQMKNHWDTTKFQWQAWGKLLNEFAGLKWDPDLQTFSAPDERWETLIKMYPETAQFRHKGLQFSHELDIIFGGTTDSENEKYKTAHANLTNDDVVPSHLPANPISSQKEMTNGSTPVTPMQIQPSPGSSDGDVDENEARDREPPPQRRRRSDGSSTSCRHRRESGTSRLDRQIDRLCGAIESRSAAMHQTTAAENQYTIRDCIECLNEMSELQPGSELYFFALDKFLKKEYRELFIEIKQPAVRLAWLRHLQSLDAPSN